MKNIYNFYLLIKPQQERSLKYQAWNSCNPCHLYDSSITQQVLKINFANVKTWKTKGCIWWCSIWLGADQGKGKVVEDQWDAASVF